MNLKKIFYIYLYIPIAVFFFSCEDDDGGSNLGDAVGTWNLQSLNATYDRTVVTKAGIDFSADVYNLKASWKDAASYATKMVIPEATVSAFTEQTLASFKAGDNAPGFPQTAQYDAAGLTAAGIALTVVLNDANSSGGRGTYTVTGNYPTIRFNPETCNSYGTVASITDAGLWTADQDASGNKKLNNFILEPDINLGDQVLPPFPDGTYLVDRSVSPATFKLDFLDRDAHDSRYSEVQTSWSEENDRVNSGLDALPVNSNGAFDPYGSTDPAAEAYIVDPNLLPWGGYLTFFALNCLVETEYLKANPNPKRPLADANEDGVIDVNDMLIFMIVDIQNGYASKTVLGVDYSLLVDFSSKINPVPSNDSASIFDLSNMSMGGKLTYKIDKGVCMPVNEIITFSTNWNEAED